MPTFALFVIKPEVGRRIYWTMVSAGIYRCYLPRNECLQEYAMGFNTKMRKIRKTVSIAVLMSGALALSAQEKAAITVTPSTMPKLGSVDSRFVSYNVEMVEVTGGRFWKPYKSAEDDKTTSKPATSADANQQVGGTSSLYQYRPPINLASPRLRKLAQALGPSYVRVSGTWQNSTYFQNDNNPALGEPPTGFKGVLTQAQWKGVVDFAHAVDNEIVTSFAISAGTRDADSVWTSAQAKAFVEYTKSIGGSIAATEFMNEPTFPGPGGAPAEYNAEAYARDAKVFQTFLRSESPQTIFLGPGGVGEGVSLAPGGMKMKLIGTEDVMKATGPIFDAFSYHFYGTVSRRCMGSMSVDKALTAEWLDRTEIGEAFYEQLRDKYLPGKPMWLSETAEAACGGDQFAGEFADIFRYLNQLGALAQKGVRVVMHNTLASSDYGLLNEDTLEPRPDFWAALLWKRTMGEVVLDPGIAKSESLRIYAHCSKDTKGGVALVVLNTDSEHERMLSLPVPAAELALTAPDLTSTTITLNGKELRAESDGSVGPLKADEPKKGLIRLAPSSVTFLTIPSARNKSCM
jgi:heparanase 1